MSLKIYLDHNATTPLDPRVLEAMAADFVSPYNPSSVHFYGREARNLLTKARRQVAELLGVSPPEVIFTSGGTEAVNLAIRGFLFHSKGHVITSTVEHTAVLSTLAHLPNVEVTYLRPGAHGAVRPEQVGNAIRSDTRLLIFMATNNETGVMTDVDGIAKVADSARVPLFIDGIAWLGKAEVTLPKGVSAAAFSGHKIHGPKGIGVLIARQNLHLAPQVTGGAQQYERRGGTENLGGILGFARALELVNSQDWSYIQRLRDQLERGILSLYPQSLVNGEGPRICNTSNIAFGGIDGESLLMNLDLAGVAASHGSACSSGSLEPSHVLLGMDYPGRRARSSIRFSLSRLTTEAEIEQTLRILETILSQLTVRTAMVRAPKSVASTTVSS